MKPLRVKILGRGGSVGKKHVRAYESLPDLYQIVDSGAADIVDICTPNWLHFSQACEAMQSGMHAIVEKPVCGSLAEIASLAHLEREAGHRICPIFQYRFADHEPVGFDIATSWKRDAAYYAGWRGNWDTALGGAMTSHGIHAMDLLIAKNGMPNAVQVLSCTPTDSLEREVSALLLWEAKSGSLSVRLGPEIEQGGFRLGDSNAGFVNQLGDICAALTGHGDLTVTLADARRSLEVATACYYSAYTKTQVTLPMPPEHPFFHGWTPAFARRASRQHMPSPACR